MLSTLKQINDDDESNDKCETEAEQSSITSYEMALRLPNDLQLFFAQNKEEEISGAMFNVVAMLEITKLTYAKKMKQTSIVQYLNS